MKKFTYELKLHKFLVEKHKSARRMIGFFVPRTRVGLALRDLGTNLFSVPWIAGLTLKRVFMDDLKIPRDPLDDLLGLYFGNYQLTMYI